MINQIFNEDCLETMSRMKDNSVDLILTDPPYNTTKNEWDNPFDLKVWWEEINRIKKEKSAVIIFSAQPFTTDLIVSNREAFRYSLVWDKVLPVGFLNSGKMPLRQHEDICIFYDKLPYYKPIMSVGHERKVVKFRNSENNNNYGDFKDVGGYDSTERFPTSLMTFSNGGNRNKILHPTQKPLELVKHLLRMYAFKGVEIYDEYGEIYVKGTSVVFDPFIGSGTTAIACKSLGLNYIGSELDKDYYEIINKRLEAVQGSLF